MDKAASGTPAAQRTDLRTHLVKEAIEPRPSTFISLSKKGNTCSPQPARAPECIIEQTSSAVPVRLRQIEGEKMARSPVMPVTCAEFERA